MIKYCCDVCLETFTYGLPETRVVIGKYSMIIPHTCPKCETALTKAFKDQLESLLPPGSQENAEKFNDDKEIF